MASASNILSKSKLTNHINEGHKKIKNHKCEECGYVANAGNLKIHIKAVHKKIRNVVWDECGYFKCIVKIMANKTCRKFLREQQEKPPFMILVLETIEFTKAGERNIWNLLLLIKNAK